MLYIKAILRFIIYTHLYFRGVFSLGVVHKPLELIYLSPKDINYLVKRPDDYRRSRFGIPKAGLISGGAWGKQDSTFEEVDVYLAFREHFIDGMKWEDTAFYNRVSDGIKLHQKVKWGCKSIIEFEQRLQNLDSLYQNIKNDGYKTLRSLSKLNKWEDEVRVVVAENGEVLFVDGRHRLSIAKILELDKIPVVVTMWHKNYITEVKGKVRKRLLNPKLLSAYLSRSAEQK